jgi:hypothetical protein
MFGNLEKCRINFEISPKSEIPNSECKGQNLNP